MVELSRDISVSGNIVSVVEDIRKAKGQGGVSQKQENNILYTHIPEEILLQIHQQSSGTLQPEVPHQHSGQGGPQDKGVVERDGEEEEDDGGDGQRELERHDDLNIQHLPKPKQLVRRRYRLKVGIKRDGLLQPTVSNYFKLVVTFISYNSSIQSNKDLSN